MTYDGKALARARETIHRRKLNNEAEQRRRREQALALAPELAQTQAEITRLMTDVALEALRQGADAENAVRETQRRTAELIKGRLELLRLVGLPENWLDDIFSCDKCGDTGYVEGRVCECLKAEYKLETAKALSYLLNLGQRGFESFDVSLYEPSYPGEKPEELRAHASNLLSFCRGYAENFDESSRNLLFIGDTGLGKTFLSACIARVVSEKGWSVVYDTCVAVMEAFEAHKFERNAEEAQTSSSQVKRYLSCDLLILDDLGTEMTTSFTQSALYTLINTRLVNGKQTIISTNLSDDELQNRYTAQTVSRLRGEYIPLLFRGRDIREVRGER